MTATIRRADEQDVPALAATLADAFHDYAWTRWVVDHDDHARRLRELYAVYLGLAVRFGEVWMTEDASGAAAWTWSESNAASSDHVAAEGLDRRIAELSGERLANAGEAAGLLEPHALTEPHWFLAAVGVAPERQNQGLGSRLLQPRLERCDADGHVAALETSAPGNVRLYERLGFTVRGELDVPGGGPHVWLMRRDPKS